MSWSYGPSPSDRAPAGDGVAHRVADLGGQEALLDVDHLVPAARSMEAEREPVLPRRERVLELVPIAVDRARWHDRLERRRREAAEADERVPHLPVLRLELALVLEVLEPAAATRPEVPAGRLDPARARLEQLGASRLREPTLHLRRAGTDEVAGKSPAHEDDEAVQAAHPVSPVRERVDANLDLLALSHRCSHRSSVAVPRFASGALRPVRT